MSREGSINALLLLLLLLRVGVVLKALLRALVLVLLLGSVRSTIKALLTDHQLLSDEAAAEGTQAAARAGAVRRKWTGQRRPACLRERAAAAVRATDWLRRNKQFCSCISGNGILFGHRC